MSGDRDIRQHGFDPGMEPASAPEVEPAFASELPVFGADYEPEIMPAAQADTAARVNPTAQADPAAQANLMMQIDPAGQASPMAQAHTPQHAAPAEMAQNAPTTGTPEPAHMAGPAVGPAYADELTAESADIHSAATSAEPAGVHAAVATDTSAGTHAVAPAATAPAGAHAATSAPDQTPAHAVQPASAPVAADPTAPTADPAHAANTAPASPTEEPAVIPDPAAASPEDTAEIDVQVVEAKLSDPGSTQSFEAITDERIDADSTFDAGATTQLMWGARSDVGCVRSHNEDSYLVASPLFAVCDGMGGHAAGEVASSIAVETIAKTAPSSADAALLGAAIEAANAAVIEAAMNGVGRPGMGCTATAAYIDGTTLALAHVGDSRAYLMHEGTLIRVTRDHSYVEELVDAGEITADEARVHPNRSVITRALGSDPAMYADHFQLNIEEGDRLILCSDGLSGMVPDGEIEAIAAQSATAQICTDNLVDAALAAGGSDNVTVVVVDVVNDGRMRQLARRHRRNVILSLAALLIVLALGAVITIVSVSHSVYLGVKDDAVAIYTGVPNPPFGLKLHWLEDETSVSLEDLPEDTQARLREGIPQKNLDEAMATVTNYRKQIDEAQSKQLQDAAAIRQSQDPVAAAASPAPAAADATATPPSDAAPAPTTDPAPEGGAAS